MPSTEIHAKDSILNELAQKHEPFREIIERFGLLLRRQASMAAELPVIDMTMDSYDEKRFLGGEPLVSFIGSDLFGPLMRQAASGIWPLLGITFPPMSEALAALKQRLETDSAWLDLCLRAVVHGDVAALDTAAAKAGVTPDFLLMALRAAYGPCIASQKKTLLAQAPADLWRISHCPVCGSDPDMASLESHAEKTDFLVSKGGEIWHHCPVCSHHWRFMRLTCPGCGNQDHERLTRFSLADYPRENIYACEDCGRYLPCLDLLERFEDVDFGLAALGLVHLDAVAQSRGYAPLSPAPWTALGLADTEAKAS